MIEGGARLADGILADWLLRAPPTRLVVKESAMLHSDNDSAQGGLQRRRRWREAVAVGWAIISPACSAHDEPPSNKHGSQVAPGEDSGSSDAGQADSTPSVEGVCNRDDPMYCPDQYPENPVHYLCKGDFDVANNAKLAGVVQESCQLSTGEANPPGTKGLCCADLGGAWTF